MTDEAGDNRPDDAVRRLLAEARHTEPMPAEVAARMDDVLADLRDGTGDAEAPEAERSPDAAPTPLPTHPVVASLAAQRRRRAAGMLVAAAAVVVGAVVVVPLLPSSTSSSSSPSSAGDNADMAGGSSQSRLPEADSGKIAGGQVRLRNGRVLVRPDHFTSDAEAARRLLDRARATGSQRYQMLDRPAASCVVPRGDGTLVNATYESAPAVLVFHRPQSSTQVVDLFVCGSDRPVRSATLPLP